jgi:hypothetical protein
MKEQNINLTIKPFGPRNGEYYKQVDFKILIITFLKINKNRIRCSYWAI